MKILIVEDDRIILDLLKFLFESNEFTVRSATSLEEARREFDHEQPDVIILDRMVEGKDGLQFCGEVRGRGARSAVFFLSGRGRDSDIATALKAGADAYMVKPFDCEELLARVRNLPSRSQGSPS